MSPDSLAEGNQQHEFTFCLHQLTASLAHFTVYQDVTTCMCCAADSQEDSCGPEAAGYPE